MYRRFYKPIVSREGYIQLSVMSILSILSHTSIVLITKLLVIGIGSLSEYLLESSGLWPFVGLGILIISGFVWIGAPFYLTYHCTSVIMVDHEDVSIISLILTGLFGFMVLSIIDNGLPLIVCVVLGSIGAVVKVLLELYFWNNECLVFFRFLDYKR